MTLKNLSALVGSMQSAIDRLPFKDILLPNEFKLKYSEFVTLETPSGYQSINWDLHTARIVTSSGKSIYLPNYWFYVASQLAHLIGALEEHRAIFLSIFSKPTDDKEEIAKALRNPSAATGAFKARITSHFAAQTFGPDEQTYFEEFVSDYAAWGGGKTIDRQDYYVSPLLKAGNMLAETQAAVAEIASQLAAKPELWSLIRDKVEAINVSPTGPTISSKGVPSLGVQGQTVLPKPFVLLAGISGTGKTLFVRRQAEIKITEQKNYELIPVRPDWHEPSDLLGYVTRIDGERYVPTLFLEFLVAAWCDAFEKIDAGKIVLRPLDEITTYWACLDEMNLAPVEQYFADYLAVLETRRWDGVSYTCDALVHPARLLGKDAPLPELQKRLGLEGKDELWTHFLEHGIPLPPNLIVAGTVNMDETTHGFSRKVIDRAFTIDFGEFFPNDFDKFFTPDRKPKSLKFSRYSNATQADLGSVAADVNGTRSVEFLKAINEPLRGTPFELAFRAMNELLLAVKCFAPADEVTLEAVWDDFLMTKLLPRIEGDAEKLRADGEKSLLTGLRDKVAQVLPKTVATGTRPDLLQTDTSGGAVQVPLRSLKKIKWMQERLTNNAFTSFWP